MKNLLTIIVFLLAATSSFAQKRVLGSIKGIVTDTAYKETLADATISVLGANPKDSSIISYTRADEKGAFQIKNIAVGSYRLIISFQGYNTVTHICTISLSSPDISVGSLNMTKADDIMEEIIVERPPISIRGDTVEFRAGAFKTFPNAKAEDLLKKLPGVEVDKEGAVTAQGEVIQKIYVDGKEFFGSDPKMATKNITADMIESVQVFEDMSEQAKFTKVDDGSRTKTINIKLKKNMRQGYFGRGTVGYGTKDRYTANIIVNRFNNDRRISAIFSSNNLNSQGFNSRDIVGNMGGYSGGGKVGGGINTSTNAGINYTDNLGSKIEVQGSYMYGESRNKTDQTSFQRNSVIDKDSTAAENETNISSNTNRNHNLNLRLEYNIDSLNSVLYTPSLIVQNSNEISFDTTSTRITKGVQEYLGIAGISRRMSERKGITLNNELLYRRRFKKYGRTLTLGFKNAVNNSDGDGKNYSPLSFFKPNGDLDSLREQDFISQQETRSVNYVWSTSYTEPLGKNKILELNYAYTNNSSTSDRNALSYRSNTKQYDSINPQQTNKFENRFLAHRVGLNFRYNNNGYSFQIGGAMQASGLDNKSVRGIYSSIGIDTTIRTKENYINLFPTANFRYEFSRRKNIRMEYQGRTNQPNVRQLQDVRDETNALRTSVGNPGLKQEFTNRLNATYRTFNETNFRYFNVNVNYNQTSNKIVNSISLDTPARGSNVQLIKPVNLNGAFDASYDVSFGLPLRKSAKGSSINLGNRMRYARDVSLLFGNDNFTNTFSASQSLGINLDIREKLNTGFRGRVSYNLGTYDETPSLNYEYFAQNYSIDVSYFVLKNLLIASDFEYTINSGLSNGFNRNVPLWNSSLAYQLFSKKNGEIRLSVNDILNQNSSIERSQGPNFFRDTRTVILQRYFMLTFTYNLNRFGKNGMQGGSADRDFHMRGERNGGRQRRNNF
ncbi:MAG: outer membrane beta-barrel protein [Chitinophagaceae bacterium]|nr:outer membrane beta-barrel protein [Chitinophagaceae bacterium]